jgi:hypothetical protein
MEETAKGAPMPKVSYAELITDWQDLLDAAEPYVAEFPNLPPLLASLRLRLDRAKELDARRLRLEAERRLAVQELGTVKTEGKDDAMRLRVAMKANLGLRNEALTAFNIRLRRKYKKRKPAPEPAGTAPEAKGEER